MKKIFTSKIFNIFFALLISLQSFLVIMVNPTRIKAEVPVGSWYAPTYKEWHEKVYNSEISPPTEIFGERYTAAQVTWIIYSLFAFIIDMPLGQELTSCLMTKDIAECKTVIDNLSASQADTQEKLATQKPKGIVASIFEARPLSFIHYTKSNLRKFHLVPEASAAEGFGYGRLKEADLQGLWKGVRDVSYIIFVIVILIMAFMIMFRVKISPQTVITIQSALPKIVIGMILVTFSYAIAGLMIDLMYVLIGFLSLIFGSVASPFKTTPQFIYQFLTTGIFNTGIFGLIIVYILIFCLGVIIAFVGKAGIIGTLGGFKLGVFLAILILLVLLIILIWNGIKILWMLLKTFTNILLLALMAPIQITLGLVIPNFGFGNWLKNFFSNLIVFPATGLLFLLAYLFLIQGIGIGVDTWINSLNNLQGSQLMLEIVRQTLVELTLDITPLGQTAGTAALLVGSPGQWPPLLNFSENSMSFLFLLSSFVIITIIPKTVELIKSFMQGKELSYGSSLGQTVGEMLSFGTGVGYGLEYYGKKRGTGRGGADWENIGNKIQAFTQAVSRFGIGR